MPLYISAILWLPDYFAFPSLCLHLVIFFHTLTLWPDMNSNWKFPFAFQEWAVIKRSPSHKYGCLPAASPPLYRQGHLVQREAMPYSEKPCDSSEGTCGNSKHRQSSWGTKCPIYYLNPWPSPPPLMHSQSGGWRGPCPIPGRAQSKTLQFRSPHVPTLCVPSLLPRWWSFINPASSSKNCFFSSGLATKPGTVFCLGHCATLHQGIQETSQANARDRCQVAGSHHACPEAPEECDCAPFVWLPSHSPARPTPPNGPLTFLSLMCESQLTP